jgi:hypothetical protein
MATDGAIDHPHTYPSVGATVTRKTVFWLAR